MKPINRRTVLQAASGTAALAMLPAHASDSLDKAARAVADDGHLTISFDAELRTSLRAAGKTLTGWDASESLLLAAGPADKFAFVKQRAESLADAAHGAGRRTIVEGRATTGLEKQVRVDFFDRYSGFALLQVAYRNTGTKTLDVKGWRNGAHEFGDAPGGFWSFSGATHEDRRDWVQPLKAGFRPAQFFCDGGIRLRWRYAGRQYLAARCGARRWPRRSRPTGAGDAGSQDVERRAHRRREHT
jgi:alpha-galactosidase